MQIIHGIIKMGLPVYRNTVKLIPNIPNKLRIFLYKKEAKFRIQLFKKNRQLEFTFGIDDETGVSALAVVHPKDQFCRKIGYNIVKGRILRQNGNYKYRYRYHPLPEYIEVNQQC